MIDIYEKCLDFSVRIVGLYKYLCNEKKEFVLSKQLLKSGTSIGANLYEAKHAQSGDDFIHKYSISLKEASETKYWIELLYRTEYLTEKEYNSLMNDCVELNKILSASLVKLKNK